MLSVLAPYSPFLVGLILLLLLVAFATEIRPPEVTAIGAAGLLLALGLISTDDILAAMSNPAPLTIAAMFIISGALVRTGTLELFALKVTGLAKASPVLAASAATPLSASAPIKARCRSGVQPSLRRLRSTGAQS